ncbi:MAG: galactose mutarotase [Polyangiaceae bacterium]
MTSAEAFTIAATPDPVESLELLGPRSRLVLAPTRGGMATRLKLHDRELFYLDEETLHDPAKNVRGGNPVLFPSPGKLEGDAYVWKDQHGTLKQHGFARNSVWEVLRTSMKEGGASATLRLVSSEQTRRDFPWNFSAEYTYLLTSDSLRIDMSFTNTGEGAMPFGAGFHPYFAVPQADKAHAHVETTATRAFDNVTKKTDALSPIDLTKPEVDLHLVDHHGDCVLRLASGRVRLKGSSEFSRWVVWTLAGKGFVCIEPWTCPGNALNTGESVIVLEPEKTRRMWVEISLV